jgi:hypothetical protein
MTLLRCSIVAVLIVFTSCTVNPTAAGFNCAASDECQAGLRCFVGFGAPGQGCVLPTSGQCSAVCTTTADCSSLQRPPGVSTWECVPACEGTDAGPAVSYCAGRK